MLLSAVCVLLFSYGLANTVNGYSIISVEGQQRPLQQQQHPRRNDAPIIGVLAQEMSYHLNTKWPGVYSSYIAASYIKFVEGGGARAVPIWIGKDKEYYEEMMGKVNGILFPGGSTWFNQTNGYASAGRHIFDIAQRMNDNNQYMPLFGTCLGFELLLFLSAGGRECRGRCRSESRSLALNFTNDYRDSRMFGQAPDTIARILSSENVTPNFHSFCITKQNLTDFQFEKQWKVLSWNQDDNGIEFVSSIEHRQYPFYGVQFHPEKVIYEWIRNRNISHTPTAIQAAQWFATFFVDEARLSSNKFTGVDEENRVLIYNYQPTFTALVKSAFEQSYLFQSDVDYRKSSSASANGRPTMHAACLSILGLMLTVNSIRGKCMY